MGLIPKTALPWEANLVVSTNKVNMHQFIPALPIGYSQSHPVALPVAIDYPAALALRQMALVQGELPKYLLAPEVSALLHYVPDLHRKMLLATLKQRNENAAITAGRAPAGIQAHHLVPLSDKPCVSQLEIMVATLKIPLERCNKRTGRTEKTRIWEITDRTVKTWLSEAVEAAAADGV